MIQRYPLPFQVRGYFCVTVTFVSPSVNPSKVASIVVHFVTMNNQRLRCIVGARVSVLTGPQKVSQLAQIETGARWVEQNGGEVVGTFEDLGVSASVEPTKRPDLGPWLTDPARVHLWDALVFSKMDRAFRSTRHCVDLAAWCEENGKILVFSEDGLKLDYSPGSKKGIDSMLSELFVYLGSFFAQMELARFKSRTEDSHRMLRRTTRWASGGPPFGYRTVPHPSGKGKGLEQDPDKQETLHSMADWLLAGESFTGIAIKLGGNWTTQQAIQALTSLRTQGYKVSKGVPVLDDEGDLISLAPPSFDDSTWAQIQTVAQERKLTRSRTRSPNPMLGVGVCGRCGASLTQHWGTGKGNHRYYRCGRTPKNCPRMVRADTLDATLENLVLDEFGDVQVTSREWQQGNDLGGDLDRVEQSIRRLRAEEESGLIVTDEDHTEYLRRMKLLVSKRASILDAKPLEPGWVYKDTGETFAQAWERTTDPAERRRMLVERGVTLTLYNPKPLEVDIRIQE